MILTKNSKTVLSLDFDRKSTCTHNCSYCYVKTMERIYPHYLKKVELNSKMAKEEPVYFSSLINTEVRKILPKHLVRLYGGGDYIAAHFSFIKQLGFPFFIISKNLTTYELRKDVGKLTALPNLTSLVLSLDKDNMDRYSKVSRLRRDHKSKVKLAFTGTPEEFAQANTNGRKFDIFFNIKKDKKNRSKSAEYKESCPCDSGQLEHAKSCTKCSKCWRTK